ncbi:hypothetical protein [Streptomyces sp. MS2.AVA.5]|uniref:Uncharacterized protein n=1 Tax=Streptomyces achmelvichensis TaxID=3134111 RepID=A0ACC6PLI4_9ACTN
MQVRREESYVHAFVTVPVWHNPRADERCSSHDHLTPPGDARTVERAGRMVVLLFTMSALATAGFVTSYVAIPADASILAFPLGRIEALNFALGVTLGMALSCLGAGARSWARMQTARAEGAHPRRPADAEPGAGSFTGRGARRRDVRP